LAPVVLSLVLPNDSSAQQREGFILNLGVGGAAVTSKPDHAEAESWTDFAVGTDFKIGYAPSDQLLVYYSNDVAFSGSSDLEYGDDGILANGLTALGATYFLRPGERSFFVDGAVGLSSRNFISTDGAESHQDSGWGFAIGGGYEFAPHWLLGADLIIGTLDPGFATLKTRTVRIGVSWLLY
jgi:hypothetical protein